MESPILIEDTLTVLLVAPLLLVEPPHAVSPSNGSSPAASQSLRPGRMVFCIFSTCRPLM